MDGLMRNALHIERSEVHLLLGWLNKDGRKPLIIRGARQVGKSSLVRDLAKLSQRSCLELNFERYPEHAEFFKSKDPKKILSHLSLHFKQAIDPKMAILFLDEIQAMPKVIEVLRYFYEECPELPLIAAGSLLEFTLAEPEFSVPLGRIEYFHLGPIGFEDFLIAMGEADLVSWMRSFHRHEPIPLPLHERCLEAVKLFWLIGAMPEVVASYATQRSFEEADTIKQSLLQGYQEDFYKYGRIKAMPLLRRVFQTFPNLIGQKIKYTHLDSESKSAQVKAALECLTLARVIYLVYHSAANGLPLRAQIDTKTFKGLFLDIGLLCTSLGLTQRFLLHAPDWSWINRGSLAEQFIGQALLRSPHQKPELYYWVREHTQASAEVDYLWQYETHIVPIEIKAGKTGRLKSLHYFLQEKHGVYGIRFNADMPSLLDGIINLPDYPARPYQLLSLPFYLVEQMPRLFLENLG